MRELLNRLEEGKFNPSTAKRDLDIAASFLKSSSKLIGDDRAQSIGYLTSALATVRAVVKSMGPEYKDAVKWLEKGSLEIIRVSPEEKV